MLNRRAAISIEANLTRSDYVQLRDHWMKHVLGKDWLPEKHRLIAISSEV